MTDEKKKSYNKLFADTPTGGGPGLIVEQEEPQKKTYEGLFSEPLPPEDGEEVLSEEREPLSIGMPRGTPIYSEEGGTASAPGQMVPTEHHPLQQYLTSEANPLSHGLLSPISHGVAAAHQMYPETTERALQLGVPIAVSTALTMIPQSKFLVPSAVTAGDFIGERANMGVGVEEYEDLMTDLQKVPGEMGLNHALFMLPSIANKFSKGVRDKFYDLVQGLRLSTAGANTTKWFKDKLDKEGRTQLESSYDILRDSGYFRGWLSPKMLKDKIPLSVKDFWDKSHKMIDHYETKISKRLNEVVRAGTPTQSPLNFLDDFEKLYQEALETSLKVKKGKIVEGAAAKKVSAIRSHFKAWVDSFGEAGPSVLDLQKQKQYYWRKVYDRTWAGTEELHNLESEAFRRLGHALKQAIEGTVETQSRGGGALVKKWNAIVGAHVDWLRPISNEMRKDKGKSFIDTMERGISVLNSKNQAAAATGILTWAATKSPTAAGILTAAYRGLTSTKSKLGMAAGADVLFGPRGAGSGWLGQAISATAKAIPRIPRYVDEILMNPNYVRKFEKMAKDAGYMDMLGSFQNLEQGMQQSLVARLAKEQAMEFDPPVLQGFKSLVGYELHDPVEQETYRQSLKKRLREARRSGDRQALYAITKELKALNESNEVLTLKPDMSKKVGKRKAASALTRTFKQIEKESKFEPKEEPPVRKEPVGENGIAEYTDSAG